MKDSSLKLVLTKVMQLLNQMDLPEEDKIELMFNFIEFLDTKKYREKIKQPGYVENINIHK